MLATSLFAPLMRMFCSVSERGSLSMSSRTNSTRSAKNTSHSRCAAARVVGVSSRIRHARLAAAIQVHARPLSVESAPRLCGRGGAFAEARERDTGGGLPRVRRIERAQAILDPAIRRF